MSNSRVSLAVTIAVVLASTTARADRVPRVGVVVALTVNATVEETDALAQTLGDALREQLLVDPVAGAAVTRRLPPNGIPEDCVAHRECLSDIGSRLDADELLLLVVVKVGTRIQIDTTWADVESGESVSRDAILLEDDGDPPATVFATAATRLLPSAQPRPAEPVTPITPDPIPVDPTPPPPPPIVDVAPGRHMTTPTWIAAGVGAGALVTGTALAISARGTYTGLKDDDCDQVACDMDRIDKLERRALFADVMFGVSLAAGVTAAVFYWRSGRTPAHTVGVSASGSQAVLTLEGRF